MATLERERERVEYFQRCEVLVPAHGKIMILWVVVTWSLVELATFAAM